jgi:hypothetical protein
MCGGGSAHGSSCNVGEDLWEPRKSGSHISGEFIIALGGKDKDSLDTETWLGSEFDTNISSPEVANILYGPAAMVAFAGVATPAIEFLWNIEWATDESSPFWYEKFSNSGRSWCVAGNNATGLFDLSEPSDLTDGTWYNIWESSGYTLVDRIWSNGNALE